MEPKWIGWKPGRSKAWRLRVLVTQDTKDDNIVGGATMLATAHSDTIHNAFYSRDQRSRGVKCPPSPPKNSSYPLQILTYASIAHPHQLIRGKFAYLTP
jgi:hypothetical protein